MKKTKILIAMLLTCGIAVSVSPIHNISKEVKSNNGIENEIAENYSVDESLVVSEENNISANTNIQNSENNTVNATVEEVNPQGDINYRKMKEVKDSDIISDTFEEDGENINLTYVKDQVVFRAKKGVSFEEVKDKVNEDDGVIVGYINNIGQYQVEYPNSNSDKLEEKMDKLKNEEILRAETVDLNRAGNVELSVVSSVNDPWASNNVSWDEENPYGSEWGIEAVKALSAWKYSDKMNSVKVGVLEVGKFFDSEDLNFKKKYANDGETENYHANHVAGTIGATSNNGKGVSGTASNSKLYGYGKTRTYSQFVENVEEAIIEDNVKVLNYSIGLVHNSVPTESEIKSDKKYSNRNYGSVLKELLEGDYNDEKYDFVIAASAGNSRNDKIKVASAAINSNLNMIGGTGFEDYNEVRDRIIVVGAMKNNNTNASQGENYGLTSFTCLGQRVDVMAPGQRIYSSLHDNVYDYKDGTSMAAPHVAGVASMIWGLDPSLTGKEVRDYIVKSADRNISYSGNELTSADFKGSYPVVNAANAINNMVKDGRVKAVDGWNKIDNKWYYYSNGNKLTGWIQPDSWYYLDESGAMVTGWKELKGTWYYFKDNGAMATGWTDVNGTWYYMESDGAMVTGWKQVNGTWYYMEQSGAMVTGWKQIGGTWYYMEQNGAMVTGWKQIDGTWYYFNASGAWVENA